MAQRLNTAEMAGMIANSSRYEGGYLYPGTTWEAPGLRLSQTRRWVKSPADPGDVDANIGALSSLPIGAVLTERTRFSDDEDVAQWIKTGQDRFEFAGENDVVIALRYSRPFSDEPATRGSFVLRFPVDIGDLVFHLEPCASEHQHAGKARGECFDALEVNGRDALEEYIRLGWLYSWASR